MHEVLESEGNLSLAKCISNMIHLCSVEDSHHPDSDPDPDPAFNFDDDQDPSFHFDAESDLDPAL